MRHRKLSKKLGRSSSHREATLASLVCSLIEERRIQTTLVKAKEARRLAEKMVTLGRVGDLTARRQAIATLRREAPVSVLFSDLAPQFEGRAGGYTRIAKLGQRNSDGSEMAVLEWVGVAVPNKGKKTKEKTPETAAS
jgi:large subunit ribosomal protein L17